MAASGSDSVVPAFTASVGFTSDSGPPQLNPVHLENSGLRLLTASGSVESQPPRFSRRQPHGSFGSMCA
jgi:hypothetical protein